MPKGTPKTVEAGYEEPVSDQASEAAQAAAQEVPKKPVLEGYLVLRLVKKNKAPVFISGEDDVVNPKTGKTERVRLIRGISSIWGSDQEKLDPKYVEKNMRSLEFKDGVCRIPYRDSAAVDFARVCNHIIDNPSRRSGSKYEFFEWNPQRQAEAALAKEMKEFEAMEKVFSTPIENVKQHLVYLGGRLADELGFPLEDKALRAEYSKVAKANPEKFLSTIDSKEVTISFLVKRAIRESKIDINREPGRVYWSAGGGFISAVPQNKKVDEYLTELALTSSEEGRSFVSILESVIK